MKKKLCIALSIMLTASLCACGAKEPEVTQPAISSVTSAEVSVETEIEKPEASVSITEPEVEVSTEEPVVEAIEPVIEKHEIQFADKLEFAQVGVPQTIHLCQFNVDDDNNYIKFSDSIFESEFTLLNLYATDNGDTIVYEIMFKYDLSNWDYDHDKYSSWMNIFDLDNEVEIDADQEDSLVKWSYNLGYDEEDNAADYFVIEAPKDMHLVFYVCANIHEDDYSIDQFEGMGPEISWAIAHFKSAFVDLNPELVNE